MDITDKKILKLLAENANIPTVEISKKTSLSVPAINKRIKRLQVEGVIKNTTILTNGKMVNKPITAFILVVLRYKEALERMEKAFGKKR